MNLRLPLTILAVAVGLAVHAQVPAAASPEAAATAPQLDVISVKTNKTGGNMRRSLFTADGLSNSNVTVHMLLTQAYGLNDEQILGEPAWVKTDTFDIEARVAGPDVATLSKLSFEQRRTMFQQVLRDRFKLAAHHETKEMPVYVLTVQKGGPRLKESAPLDPTPSPDGLPRGPSGVVSRGKITAEATGMDHLATILSRQLGRTTLDKTGLTGAYDITLQWAPDEGAAGPRVADAGSASSPDSAPSIFTALQEQMGLKLESTKGPVDVVVIDHIEKPTEN